MRVISLVPSLTETLIACGVNVVGRTRFCIHPADKVAQIPKVGGTKGVDWERCKTLNPDLVIFDKEENLLEMATECPFPWMATHIQSLDDCSSEFNSLADRVESQPLVEIGQDWLRVSAASPSKELSMRNFPGQLEPLVVANKPFQRVEYIIWRDPWMAVSRDTFIGSVLSKLGYADYLTVYGDKYPQLSDADMQREDTFYLFSSEPYRFLRYHQELLKQGFQGAIVDGEMYSWFGIRSLRALQQQLNLELS